MKKLALALGIVLVLSGCEAEDRDDVQDYLKELYSYFRSASNSLEQISVSVRRIADVAEVRQYGNILEESKKAYKETLTDQWIQEAKRQEEMIERYGGEEKLLEDTKKMNADSSLDFKSKPRAKILEHNP